MKPITKSLIGAVCCLVAIMACAPAASAQQRGEKSFGVSTGYVSRNASAFAGLYFQWQASKLLRISPRASYVFRHNGSDAFVIDCDLHFPIAFRSNTRWRVYPLIGAGYYMWNHIDNVASDADYDDTTTRQSRFSLNVGAGVEWLATPTLKLSLQGRGALMSGLSTAWVSASIGYVF